MTDPSGDELKIEELELRKETMQDLTQSDAENVEGGALLTPAIGKAVTTVVSVQWCPSPGTAGCPETHGGCG